MKRLLIISNNVISETNNNGKTILSFIEGTEDVEIAQLYLSGEVPRVCGYEYFQISDKDVIKGYFRPSKRGRAVSVNLAKELDDDNSIRQKFRRTEVTLSIRDALWSHHWKSPQLLSWLDTISPDAVFFVAGDALYPYSICRYIAKRYHSRLTVYITDDYIMPILKESILHRFRRKLIKANMRKILREADGFYTVSKPMKEAYSKELRKKSEVIFNLSDDLFAEDTFIKKHKTEDENIVFIYTGSLYYKRDEMLGKLAEAISNINKTSQNMCAKLCIYSNDTPPKVQRQKIVVEGASEYCGSLNRKELKAKLNESDVLVFVESFEQEQKEKTKFSISTKIPEYLSVGKPIIAIGPRGTGSIDYLQDVAVCIGEKDDIEKEVKRLILDDSLREIYGTKARKKYLNNHDKNKQQKRFMKGVLGESR